MSHNPALNKPQHSAISNYRFLQMPPYFTPYFRGVVVPGGFGKRGVEGKITAANWCRRHNKPFLGICLGFQAAVIELCRNVLKIDDAHTAECDPDVENPVIIDMPEHNNGDKGGTMRLGKRTTIFTNTSQNSNIRK